MDLIQGNSAQVPAPATPVASACHDLERVSALHRYRILDTPAEEAFDDITRLAAHICGAPIAVINFIEKDRQWFKSEIGLGVRETPVAVSICAHALLEDDLLVVPDTLLDSRFANNPLVTGEPHLRFYAGALLRTPEGQALGTLCVLDHRPRSLTASQLDALSVLRRQVMSQLELRRAKEEAEESNRAKDRFLAYLSHELRTPLSPALLTASAMESDEAAPPWVREEAHVIRKSIELQTGMIDSLLDVSRITHGKLELNISCIDLCASMSQAIQTFAADAAAKGVVLREEQCTDELPMRGDATKLYQVFCNLLKNAIKFTPPGGVITVRSVRDGNDRLKVQVSDTGIGIEPEAIPHIFNAFEQGDRSVTRRFGGLGLGLAICKGIVEAHGGRISVASAGSNRGATMTVELPAGAALEPARATVPPPLAGSSPSALRILLVDDHEATLKAMSRLLKRLSHRVTTASGVTSALAAASADDFDLLISDVGLPDGTGLELMQQLLMQRPIKGIALTGYGTESDIQKTREAGFIAHLTKPIDFKQLQEVIRKTHA